MEPSRAPANEAEAAALITTIGDPILRSSASLVTAFDDSLQDLVGEMLQIGLAANAVGLAAPQIGVLRQALFFRHGDGELMTLANPSIIERSDEQEIALERCLSIPGIAVEVSRSTEITVRAQDLFGHFDTLLVEGLEARILQHEIDHLNGILILDHAPSEQRKAALRALRYGQSYQPDSI